MARNPQSRDELHRRLVEFIGSEAADTLMEALPPHSWDELATKDMVVATKDMVVATNDMVLAVKADLELVKDDVAAVKYDVAAVKEDVAAVKEDVGLLTIAFERLDTKVDHFADRFDLKLEA